MITGKTKSGFEFHIPDGLDKDFRFAMAYKKCKSGDEDKAVDGAVELISAVFVNEAEEERFYQHIASLHEGRIPITELYEEIEDIIRYARDKDNAVKN